MADENKTDCGSGGDDTIIANHGTVATANFELDEPRSRSDDNHGVCACTCKIKMLLCAEFVGLAAVIAIVWGLLLLPVIFYHLPNVRVQITCSV